jgi:undecaprenyl-phosphate galactose phosphotransferase
MIDNHVLIQHHHILDDIEATDEDRENVGSGVVEHRCAFMAGRDGFMRKIWVDAPPVRHSDIERAVFRLFDIGVASTAIILFLPLFILILAAVLLTSPGPVLFVQRRVGRQGVLFPCLKIRTMRTDAAAILARLLEDDPAARAEWARDFKLRADPRITPVGDILRKLSLDELPQLMNVFVGHMSIVGPRPIVPGEIERYGIYFPDYCSVRPGLTGLWQVSGRNDVSYKERVQLDSRYAARKSVPLDMLIMVRTIPAVIRARGCY